jgi:hypothetical protein
MSLDETARTQSCGWNCGLENCNSRMPRPRSLCSIAVTILLREEPDDEDEDEEEHDGGTEDDDGDEGYSE